MENNPPAASEDSGKSSVKNQHASDNAGKPRNKDLSSQFDPSLSSREMRKIKYYEDMFARMAHESKNGMHSNNSLGQSLFKSSSSKSARSRGSNKKHSVPEPKDNTLSDYHENTLSDNHTFSKASRGHTHKKDVYKNGNDRDSLHSRDRYDAGIVTASDSAHSSSKTLLENKRLIKVQSMPMVTKKKKVAPEVRTDTRESIAPVASRVGDFDRAKKNFSIKKMDLKVPKKALPNPTPTAHEAALHEILVKSEEPKVLFDNIVSYPSDGQKHTEDTLKNEISIEADGPGDLITQKNEAYCEPDDFQEKADNYLVELDYQTPLNDVESVTDILHESPTLPLDQTEMELDDVQEDKYIDETPKISKKRSTRGRKGKNRRTPQTKDYSSEHFTDEKISPDNFVQMPSLDPELMDAPRSSVKTRLKSQRSHSRKKKQDEQAISDIKTATRNTKLVNRAVGKHLLVASRSNTSSSIDKLNTANGSRSQAQSDFANGDDSHFNIECLRIITADEAEKIINMCSQHYEDIEKLKSLVNTAQINANLIEGSEKETTMDKQKRRECILNPLNIVAPVVVDGQSKSYDNDRVPQNPLHISFKYRFFKDFGNT